MELSSRRLSESILISSESVNLECGRIGRYERLSQSMRLNGESDFSDQQRKHRKGSMGILTKLLSFTRTTATSSSTDEGPKVGADTAEKKEKKRSSWLPDPDKRWPIQGW